VLDWSVAAARRCCEGVVLVVPPARSGEAEPGADVVVSGGATRAASVRAGLGSVPAAVEWVLVHDAARPLAPPPLWDSVLATLAGDDTVDAVIPVVAVTDTLWRADGASPVDRADVVAVQTPQGFRADALRRAHAAGGEATDDASLVHAVGGRVVLVEGDAANTKVTSADDLRAAAARL
jgi:2-C-methyl-D-erythritol 4-phosphate cytidylyltransferase